LHPDRHGAQQHQLGLSLPAVYRFGCCLELPFRRITVVVI
jgi:hypothetical protein